jgi:hypothetical protein
MDLDYLDTYDESGGEMSRSDKSLLREVCRLMSYYEDGDLECLEFLDRLESLLAARTSPT